MTALSFQKLWGPVATLVALGEKDLAERLMKANAVIDAMYISEGVMAPSERCARNHKLCLEAHNVRAIASDRIYRAELARINF